MKANSNRCSTSGYTLMELIITVGIIAVMAKFTMAGMENWTARSKFSNTLGNLERVLIVARQEAEARNTTVRVLTVRTGDNYTFTTYKNNDTPATSVCDGSGSWTVLSTSTEEVSAHFEITGNGVGHTCFFRDGTASSRTFNIVQKDGGTDIRSATVIVTVATGMPDVTVTGGS